MRPRAPVTLALFALLILLAFGARVHRLGAQSLWNDEGNSLRLAQRSAADLIESAGHDIHPPGYYLALKAWIAAAGESEFSLRFLSALQGVLAVALAAALGRMLFGRGAGWLAGLLVALSPFAVYYSQETRMYAQLGLLSAASMALFVCWLRDKSFSPQRAQRTQSNIFENLCALFGSSSGIALALVNAGGLYTQYSFPFTMLAQGVLFVLWSARQPGPDRRRAALAYAALNGLTLALFLPWLPTAWDQITGWPRTGVDLALGEQIRAVLTWITYGNTAGEVNWPWLLAPGLLALAALRMRRRVVVPLVWALVGIAALFASGAYREANLKFLLPAQIAAALLIGGGAWRLWTMARPVPRALAAAGLAIALGGQVAALDALYTDPAYARDDYRAIAARIVADPRPGDAVILSAPNQWETFTYYYDGDAPVYPLPRGLGGDDAATRAEIEDILARHARVFALFWGQDERDPRRVVQAALDAGAYPVESRWYGDVRLAVYAVLGGEPGAPQVTTEARFGEHITLAGYTLSAAAVRPGDALGVTLFWTANAPLDARYKVTVQLWGPEGTLIAQHDAEPANNLALTPTWAPGETVIDPHGLAVPAGGDPGAYRVVVALYPIDAPGDRLPVMVDGAPVGDVLPMATVTVE